MADMIERFAEWGYKHGLKGIRKQVRKVIKSRRLVFIGDNHVLYIDKEGRKRDCNFDEMVKIMIDVGGWSQRMTELMLSESDIRNILEEEYLKHKKEVK